jgi:hypothetical protein
MILQSIQLLASQLNAYLAEVENLNLDQESPLVMAENFSICDEQQRHAVDGIFLSLLSINEEAAVRHHPARTEERIAKTLAREETPPYNLNVVVVSCLAKYDDALACLSHVYAFFQKKNTFSLSGSDETNKNEGLKHRISVEIQSLNLEQISHLWAILGGRHRPFILLRVRVFPADQQSNSEARPVIRRVREEKSDC